MTKHKAAGPEEAEELCETLEKGNIVSIKNIPYICFGEGLKKIVRIGPEPVSGSQSRPSKSGRYFAAFFSFPAKSNLFQDKSVNLKKDYVAIGFFVSYDENSYYLTCQSSESLNIGLSGTGMISSFPEKAVKDLFEENRLLCGDVLFTNPENLSLIKVTVLGKEHVTLSMSQYTP